ncbi:transmembrane 9 superfamily member 4-like isoform X2 [Dioscorea cayenensis subsp. rotundata]|uniref:Transmembrane 9 superfamily member n=1 Tax=Dioscorea cayennensis subsp. rotundata TaxID=55577 RepID=A0AB40BJ89_DIOCR|nr:transmembrane 9 superfamily member 4-like isoform X2 [Dioscorea cayenensis subsp. rotundata]
MVAASLTLILILVITTVSTGRHYKDGDPVLVYVNKISPFSDPIESYRYFDLPFCSSGIASKEKETLSQVLDGGRLVVGPFKLNFGVDLASNISETLCKKRMKRDDLAKFRNAIEKAYLFEMYLDDLPFWGFIGYKDQIGSSSSKFILFNNLNFVISYDTDHRICSVNLASSGFVDISEDKEMEVEFLYSVKWKETSIPFERRMDVYISLDTQSNWFLTKSSSYLVIVVAGLLASMLIWLLHNDLAKYAINDDLITDQEETGWKNIHGDVFRYPRHKSLLAASLGSGTRLLFVFVLLLIIGFLGVFPPFNQGNFATALIVIYTIASFLAGYTSTSFYCQLEGANWVKNLILTECLFSGPLFLMFCFLNTIASSPLLVLGGIAGKNRNTGFDAPCKTTKCPREIPPLPWSLGV